MNSTRHCEVCGLPEGHTGPHYGQAVTETLKERGSTHGSFRAQSGTSEAITECMRNSLNWDDLPSYAKQSLQMVAVKLGRICNGDWSYADHWRDIAGYSTLVEKELTKSP